MTNNQNEIGGSVQKSAKSSSSEQITCSDLSQLNIKNDEVSQVFDYLLQKVIQNQKTVHSQIKVTLNQISDKIAPTFLLKLFGIGIWFCILLAFISKITKSTIVVSGVPVLSSGLYLLISFGCLTLFIIFWDIELFKQRKSPQKQIEEKFCAVRSKAITNDWEIVKEITEKAKFKVNTIEYNINVINHSIEIIQSKKEINFTEVNIFAFFIAIILIFLFDPYNIIERTITTKDIQSWSKFLAFISAIAASINLLLKLSGELSLQFEISKWKECLYCLKQAQLIVSDIEANKSVTHSEQPIERNS